MCTGKERGKDKEGKKAHSTQNRGTATDNFIIFKPNDVVLDHFLGLVQLELAKSIRTELYRGEREQKYIDVAEKTRNQSKP